MDERLLVSLCCQHDRSAERELYVHFAPRLRALCLRYLSNVDDAEDLLQDVFVRIFSSLSQFRWKGEGSLWLWMRRIAVNMAIDQLRHSSKGICLNIDEVFPSIDEPTTEEVNTLPEETLLGFVATLPVGYRMVFNLVCMEGMSHKEAARLLGIAERSSASQLTRARAILAKKIKDYLRQETTLPDCHNERI